MTAQNIQMDHKVLAFAALHGHFKERIKKIKTIPELQENHKMYDENFDKLMNSMGTLDYTKYLKEERRLNRSDIRIRIEHHLLFPDPGMEKK